MEMLKKLKKRIVPLVLAVVIFATSVVSGPMSLTARAASVTVDAEFSTELAMLLYNIMETVAISSGIKDGLDDYESGSTLYDAFISYLDSAATPPYLRDTYITLADGSSMTIQDAIEAANATVGSNALKLPEEEVFAKYRTISGGKNPENSPEPSPSPTPSGDDDYVILDKFHEIAFILVSAPMLAMCTKFFEALSQGDVDGVDSEDFYPGILPDDFLYHLTAVRDSTSSWPSRFVHVYNSLWSDRELCVVKDISDTSSFVSAYTGDTVNCYKYYFLFVTSDKSLASSVVSAHVNGYLDRYQGQSYYNRLNYNNGSMSFDCAYKQNLTGNYYVSLDTNMKIFDSVNSFINYCESGDTSGQLNRVPYDYHSMAAASSDTLQQLPSTKIDPNAIPALNNSMKKAANGVEATGTDQEANNAEMIAAVKAAVVEALAEAQPDPAPEPTAAPDPEPSTAPDPGTDTNYSGILGLILSAIKAIASGIWDFFCDPMGAITTGLTNLYNGVLRIIEIFPEQVQLVLGNIASLPSAMLQVFADPLGAIQSLLGALPSWANLQAYLDKILQALLDPVSALQPSGPGGSDPGGDSDSGKHTPDLLSLLNGLILLIMILLMLLRIFLHCLQFIVGIFKIEASPGFLPDDMVLGLNYLKTLEITGIGMSVYDFMMGLIYIFMVFGVIKLLRGFAFHIHIPKGGNR